VVLALTGFPQKFYSSGWASIVAQALGGVPTMRFIHRGAGLLLGAFTLLHFTFVLRDLVLKHAPPSMIPARQDFRDVVHMLRYYLRLEDAPARFDRFDYREKFEYWGLVFGNLIMVATGLVLLFPILVARHLPGELIPAAKIAHSNEGLMAFLVVVTWHIYNAHFAPDIFPFNKTIFTGRISIEHLKKEHPLEYERLFPDAAGETEVRRQAAAKETGKPDV
jgi:cytochrome b subunit of formate dehydrogenase